MSSSFRRDRGSDRDYERRRSIEDIERYDPPRYSAATSGRREDIDRRDDPGPSTAGPRIEPRVYQRVDDDDSSLDAPPPQLQPASIRNERTGNRQGPGPPPELQPVAQPIRLPEVSRRRVYHPDRDSSISSLQAATENGPRYPRDRESPPSPLHLVIENAPRTDNGRSYRVPPGPPSPHRRWRPEIHMEVPRPPRERPQVRRVPPGFVQPAPYLPLSERLHSHDLTGIAQGPDPKSDPKVRENLVLCVYRNSKKSFDYRFVKLISGHGRKDVVVTDLSLFYNMRDVYENELRGWIRRFFSFKGLTTVRLLQVSHC